MRVEQLTEKDRSLMEKNKTFLGETFGYKGDVGRVSSQEAVTLIDEDFDKWVNNYELYRKLLSSALQSLEYQSS